MECGNKPVVLFLFYMTTALLLRHSIKAQTHSGVKSEFARRFVKEGIVGKEHFRLYSDLMDWRQKGIMETCLILTGRR